MYLLYFATFSQIRISGLEIFDIVRNCNGRGMKYLWAKFGLG